MHWGFTTGLIFVLIFFSFGLSRAVIAPLRRRALLDHPNDRSSHSVPTPRGGGLAVTTTILIAVSVSGGAGYLPGSLALGLSALTLFLAVVSWIDDIQGLGPLVRFGSHIAAVIAALYLGLVTGPFFAGALPGWAELLLIGLGWVWFVNLFNFMDGIDGIAAMEAVSIGAGGAALAFHGGVGGETALIGLIVAAAALGFLPSNWNPAKIFLGDVGSIPLGFLCAWILLSLASNGMAAAALILSLVFLTDATLTLLKRLMRREKIWQAHRQHFYQQAVQRGLSHGQTTGAAALANLALIGLAFWSLSGDAILAIIGGLLVSATLFTYYLKSPVPSATTKEDQ